ncbi:class E sortase [Streptomyces sp. NE5-10]|uniref:class E sortase n=1 Tax=Streptomyces sp. NE5-10 TaxID=2759674 RepID=UPI0019042919|nr:class E sortase [Streptomyces sp. NE5-10]GHJ91951.1 class E sortase [Streptomyces sp. NE5-10]
MTTGSPWFRASEQPGAEPIPPEHGPDPYAHERQDPYGHAAQQGGPYPYPAEQPYETGAGTPYGYDPKTAYGYETAAPVHEAPYEQARHEQAPYGQPRHEQAPYADVPWAEAPYQAPREAAYEPVREPYGAEGTRELPQVSEEAPAPVEPLPGPGRAERRRAAAKQGRGKGRTGPGPDRGAPAGRPLSRVEARRAAREAKAAKDSVGVVVGELFITLGVVMLLFVAYQLWWTNVLAGQETHQAKEKIEDTWAKGESKPDVFAPGEGFAIMYIPKLDVVVPVAEGISKPKVLDKGMVGHYGEGKLKTAMPADKQGNFAVAGHRNTHGEPFRYINRLKPGDPIVVETQDAYYTYEMASILPQTSPSNIAVIDPVPKGSGFTGPGRYITLTTCTPEFTSTYRMIVWGKLVEERPRSKGKPTALVG